MKKLSCFNNQANNSFSEKRLVMQMAKGPEVHAAQPPAPEFRDMNLGQRLEYKYNEDLNCETPFNSDPAKLFEALAIAANKQKPGTKTEDFMAAFKQNLNDRLKDGKTEQQFFEYLQSQHCTSVKVAGGAVEYFSEENGLKQIKLEDFIDVPIRLNEGTATSERYLKRKEILENSMNQLAELVQSSKLPEYPAIRETRPATGIA